jgi:iron complex transport system substrate-binding protein
MTRPLLRLAVALTLLCQAMPAQAESAKAEPAKIVALGGTVSEIVAALGQEGRMVARDSTSTYPESLTALPDVGYVRALSPEGVLSVEPDLILADEGAGPAETVDVLKASGVPYIVVPDSFAPDGIAQKINVIGAALGQQAAASDLAAKVDAGLAEARAKAAAISVKKRVLFILTLQGGRVMAAGEGSSADAIIALAGGTNAATGFQGYKPMTDEAVLAAAPDTILMMESEGPRTVSDEDVKALPALADSPAVKSGAILRMDGLKLLGFGPRTPEAATELRAALYGQ